MIIIDTVVNHPGSVFNGEPQGEYNVVLSGELVRTPESLTLKMNGGALNLDENLFEDLHVGSCRDVKIRLSWK